MVRQQERLTQTLADVLDAMERNQAKRGPSRADPDEPQLLIGADVFSYRDRAVDFQQDPVGMSLQVGLRELAQRIAKRFPAVEYDEILDRAVRRSGNVGARTKIVETVLSGVRPVGQ